MHYFSGYIRPQSRHREKGCVRELHLFRILDEYIFQTGTQYGMALRMLEVLGTCKAFSVDYMLAEVQKAFTELSITSNPFFGYLCLYMC
jgi:hypothetical protein